MERPPQPVLLYDAECGLCNALVRFMLGNDRRGVLAFAPLQGRTGQRLLRIHGMDASNFESLMFVHDMAREGGALSLRSAGALDALEEMGGGFRRAARVLRVIPKSWSDMLYRLIARSRYRIFGRYQPTPLPNPEWERRVLD